MQTPIALTGVLLSHLGHYLPGTTCILGTASAPISYLDTALLACSCTPKPHTPAPSCTPRHSPLGAVAHPRFALQSRFAPHRPQPPLRAVPLEHRRPNTAAEQRCLGYGCPSSTTGATPRDYPGPLLLQLRYSRSEREQTSPPSLPPPQPLLTALRRGSGPAGNPRPDACSGTRPRSALREGTAGAHPPAPRARRRRGGPGARGVCRPPLGSACVAAPFALRSEAAAAGRRPVAIGCPRSARQAAGSPLAGGGGGAAGGSLIGGGRRRPRPAGEGERLLHGAARRP